MFDEKAQLHTLEGVTASTIILLVIIYAIDATSMTPLTSSTSNAHIETELQILGEDILNALDHSESGYNSKLKNDVINWDGSEYFWNGTNYRQNGNTSNFLDNNLTDILIDALVGQGIAHKVELVYLIESDNITEPSAPEKIIFAGEPSDNAVIVSRKVVLQDNENVNITSPIGDIDPGTNLYNIADVKLTLWRT